MRRRRRFRKRKKGGMTYGRREAAGTGARRQDGGTLARPLFCVGVEGKIGTRREKKN